jgi:hypothetical protein
MNRVALTGRLQAFDQLALMQQQSAIHAPRGGAKRSRN